MVYKDHQQLLEALKMGEYAPVYLLMGEEPYFIDRVLEHFTHQLQPEAEREFDQTILYGKDSSEDAVIDAAKRYPMISSRHVVVVQEAQLLNSKEALARYAQNPVQSTILVLAHKHKTVDQRTAWGKKLVKSEHVVTLEANKIREYKVPEWVQEQVEKRGYRIDPRTARILTDHAGDDLSRVNNELEKLMLVTDQGSEITAEAVEKNIGISKDHNIFELQNALSFKDASKAFRIVDHFAMNPRRHPLPGTVGSLYKYFTKVLLLQQLKTNNEKSIASELKLHPYFVKEYRQAAKNYPVKRLRHIFSILREYDLKAKGWNNVSTGEGELLREMVLKIFNGA